MRCGGVPRLRAPRISLNSRPLSLFYDEYGLTWFRGDAMRALVAETAPELEFVAHHPMTLEGHQDVFVYRKR